MCSTMYSEFQLSDATDEIKCEVTVDLHYVGAGVEILRLDLTKASVALGNKGMVVSKVMSAGKALDFTHENDVLSIKDTSKNSWKVKK